MVIGGLRFETLSSEEIKEMDLPKLMVAVNEDGNVEEQNKENMKECQGKPRNYKGTIKEISRKYDPGFSS